MVIRAVTTSTFHADGNIIRFLHIEGLQQALAQVQCSQPLPNVKIASESDFSSTQIEQLQQEAMQFLN